MAASKKSKFQLQDYSLKDLKYLIDGREGQRWSAWLAVGDTRVTGVHDDGDGGSLRWTWEPGPTGARRHDDFRAAVAQWIKKVIPGADITEFVEPESAFICARLDRRDITDPEVIDHLKLCRMPPKPQRAPDWRTLENRLSRLVHSMKLGYSSLMSLGYPLQDIMTGQKIAIQRIEEWIADGEIDVDSWQTLDGRLDCLTVPLWCCYNAENMADDLKLGFSRFSSVTQWDTVVAPMIKLTICHRTPVFEKEPCKECSGTGEVEGMGARADCPACSGKG